MAKLQLIGASRRLLFRLLLFEAAVLGSIGSVCGIVVGIGLAWLLTGTITDSMGVIFQLRFPVDQLSIAPSHLAVIAVAGVLVAVFGSSFAARRIATLDPLETLREGVGAFHAQPSTARLLLWWGALLTISGIAFIVEDRTKSIGWGNFGSTLWNAGVIVIAIPATRWLAVPISRSLTAWFGARGRVAAESLFRSGARSGVTVAAVALILTIAIMLTSLVTSCRQSLASYFAGFFAADLTVSAVSTEGGWLETPLSPAVGRELEQIPGVRRVDTARALSGQPFRGRRIALLGVSNGFFEPGRVPDGWFHEGSPESAAPALMAGTATLVSTSFADRFRIHVGDIVTLPSASGEVSLPVVGVVPDYVSDRGSVIFNRTILQERWHETSVNRFLVSTEEGTNRDELAERIRQRLGEQYRLKILSTGALLEYHTDLIDRAFAVMNSVQLLIVIVTIAGIFDLLNARILERSRELAIWQVIGASKDAVRQSIVLESATVGVIGAVLGVLTGAVTAWLWVRVHFRQLLGYYVEYHFAGTATAWYVLLVLVMTMVAGYAAARAAVRQSVLDGIREE